MNHSTIAASLIFLLACGEVDSPTDSSKGTHGEEEATDDSLLTSWTETTECSTTTSPCTFSTRVIDIDEPLIDGLSVAALLDTAALSGVLEPQWEDGTSATVTLELDWDGTDVLVTEETSGLAECEGPPMIELGLEGSVTSDDGRLDEQIYGEVLLLNEYGVWVDLWAFAEDWQGSLDVESLLPGDWMVDEDGIVWAFMFMQIVVDADGLQSGNAMLAAIIDPDPSDSVSEIGDILELDMFSW